MTRLMMCLLLVVGLAMPAAAKDTSLENRFAAALEAGGFSIREIGYTFWGRLRIIAVLDGMEREIIVNPNTGEVLRDQTHAISAYSSDHANDGPDVAAVSNIGTTVARDGEVAVGATGALGDDVEVPLLTSPEVIEGTDEQ